jgi:hypothetical protein
MASYVATAAFVDSASSVPAQCLAWGFKAVGHSRTDLEARHRPHKVPVTHPYYGTAVIRDQQPMKHTKLERLLDDDMTPEEWYRTLNRRVFFLGVRGTAGEDVGSGCLL